MPTRAPKHPPGLGAGGVRLWRGVVSTADLGAADLRILEEACREVDLIDRLRAELVDAPSIVKGSMGQQVANPLISEVRQHVATFNTLIRGLKLPGEDGAQAAREATAATELALAGARAKWQRRTGA